MSPRTAWLVLLLWAGGCARYEYDLVQPGDLARHIGSAGDEHVSLEPLRYILRSYDDRLVVRIENPTAEPIQLVGEKSYLVDPSGQSRPLRSQTIAPQTFIKLILPPPRPYYREDGPTFGIGFGVGVSNARWGRNPSYDAWMWDSPRYYTLYNDADAGWWDWEGETDVKLTLVFARSQQTFSHSFVFHRKKM